MSNDEGYDQIVQVFVYFLINLSLSVKQDCEIRVYFDRVWLISALVLLNPDLSFIENTVDPDQMASLEAI